MTVKEIADDLVAKCREGKNMEAINAHYAPNVVSLEASGEPKRLEGIEAVRGKNEWWFNAHELHSASVDDALVHDKQFTVRFQMDVTQKESGQRFQMEEIGLYTVDNGKVVEERFFYNMG